MDSRFICEEKDDYPCLNNKYTSNELFGGGYFVQDIWGARKILAHKPDIHYNFGSSVKGFIAHLMVFNQKTIQLDIRPQDNIKTDTAFITENKGKFTFIQADATNLENFNDNSIDSLSALCSLEHFGLGRYGDPIDPISWLKALKAIQRVLKPGGKFYMSVLIGSISKICFNAHIVFHPQIIIDELDELQILELSYISGACETTYLIKTENGVTKHLDNNYSLLTDIPRNGKFGLFEFIKK